MYNYTKERLLNLVNNELENNDREIITEVDKLSSKNKVLSIIEHYKENVENAKVAKTGILAAFGIGAVATAGLALGFTAKGINDLTPSLLFGTGIVAITGALYATAHLAEKRFTNKHKELVQAYNDYQVVKENQDAKNGSCEQDQTL